MKAEKRVNKGYKIKDSIYQKAMKRAKKEKGQLAVHIEHWVQCYSEGLEINVNYKAAPKNQVVEKFRGLY